MICLTAHVLAHASLAPSKKTSYSLQTPLSLNRRSRRRKRRAAAKLRPKLKFLWTTAVSRCCLFFNPLVQSVTFFFFFLPPQACISASLHLPPPRRVSCVQVPKRIEVHSIHTYVALYKFLPQEQNDLELQ